MFTPPPLYNNIVPLTYVMQCNAQKKTRGGGSSSRTATTTWTVKLAKGWPTSCILRKQSRRIRIRCRRCRCYSTAMICTWASWRKWKRLAARSFSATRPLIMTTGKLSRRCFPGWSFEVTSSTTRGLLTEQQTKPKKPQKINPLHPLHHLHHLHPTSSSAPPNHPAAAARTRNAHDYWRLPFQDCLAHLLLLCSKYDLQIQILSVLLQLVRVTASALLSATYVCPRLSAAAGIRARTPGSSINGLSIYGSSIYGSSIYGSSNSVVLSLLQLVPVTLVTCFGFKHNKFYIFIFC